MIVLPIDLESSGNRPQCGQTPGYPTLLECTPFRDLHPGQFGGLSNRQIELFPALEGWRPAEAVGFPGDGDRGRCRACK